MQINIQYTNTFPHDREARCCALCVYNYMNLLLICTFTTVANELKFTILLKWNNTT